MHASGADYIFKMAFAAFVASDKCVDFESVLTYCQGVLIVVASLLLSFKDEQTH